MITKATMLECLRMYEAKVMEKPGVLADETKFIRLAGIENADKHDVCISAWNALADYAAANLGYEVRQVKHFGPGSTPSLSGLTSIANPEAPLEIRNRIKPQIAIRSGLNAPSKLKVLAHEVSHLLLGHMEERQSCPIPILWEIFDEPRAEVQAETAAGLAVTSLGVDVLPLSINYVAGWYHQGKGAFADPETIADTAITLAAIMTGEAR